MSTPTEANLALWRRLFAIAHIDSMDSHTEALQLLRDSEARAVEAALSVEKQWVASLTRDNGILLDAADKTKAGARCVSLAGLLERANEDLSKERERVRVLEAALQAIVGAQPCTHEGGCFYPMRDGDGEYIGEQNVDPLSVIGGMVQTAQEALATPERKEGSG